MIITDNLHLSYDLSGNLIITIPKSYVQNSETEREILLKAIAKLINLASRKVNRSEEWKGDSASDVIGICKSNINDGSVHHDRYIYGLE